MAGSNGFEFLRRLGEVENLTAYLRQRTDVGVWICALSVRRLADEMNLLQLAFNSTCAANDVEIPVKTREELQRMRRTLNELTGYLDSVVAAYQPASADPHDEPPS
jgi:hypothetical protein